MSPPKKTYSCEKNLEDYLERSNAKKQDFMKQSLQKLGFT